MTKVNYEFHVGDYAETVGGFIGWISVVENDFITVTNNTDIACGYCIPQEISCFKRIGEYDFTKENNSRIKPLVAYDALDYCNSKLMWDKINELVDVVNQLEEKIK